MFNAFWPHGLPGIAITFIAPQIFRSFLRIIAVKMITSYIYIYIFFFFFFFWTFVLEYSRLAGEGNGHPLQYSCWEIPRTEKLQSIGWLRVRQDWATEHSNSSRLAVLWQFQVSEGTQPYMCRYPFTQAATLHGAEFPVQYSRSLLVIHLNMSMCTGPSQTP